MTVAELIVEEEIKPLREVAEQRGWKLAIREPTRFVLGLRARDDSWFWLLCCCNRYNAEPPAWHWYNPETEALDQPNDTPVGGAFFHSAGVICAPWNRLAYKSEDLRGPHSDWSIGNWQVQQQTGGCKTLTAMALRIFVEIQSPNFKGHRK